MSKKLANVLSVIDTFNFFEKDVKRFRQIKEDLNFNIFSKLDSMVTKRKVSKDDVFIKFLNIYSKYNSLVKFGRDMSDYYFQRGFIYGKDAIKKFRDNFKKLFGNLNFFKFEDIFSKKSTKAKRNIFDKFLSSLTFDFNEFLSKNNIKVSYIGASIDSEIFYDEYNRDIKVFSKKEADNFLNSLNRKFRKVHEGIEDINNFYKNNMKSFSEEGERALWSSYFKFKDYLFKKSVDNVFHKLKIKDTDRIICFDNDRNLIVSTNLDDLFYINRFVKIKFKETKHKYSKIFQRKDLASINILSDFWKTSSSAYTGAKLKERINDFEHVFSSNKENTGFFFLVSGKVYELKVLQNIYDFKLIEFSTLEKINIDMNELIIKQIPINTFVKMVEKKSR